MSTKLRLATAAVLSLAVAGTPVTARSYYGGHGRYHHYHGGGGIGLGGALLGAAIIGGVAVAASNADRGPPVAYDDAPPPREGYDVYDRDAPPVNQADNGPVGDCARAAEETAEQRGGGRAHVTGIDRVDQIDGGANVLGYLEIDRGRAGPAERLGFSCRAAYGRVTGIRLG